MEGILKRKVSIFRGYQDRWFVLAEEGFLKQYDKKPFNKGEQPKWMMYIILAEIDNKKDGLRFNIISNEGQRVQLKASSAEQRTRWTKVFRKINKKHFPLVYSDDEDDEVEGTEKEKQETVSAAPKPASEPKVQQTSRISFDKDFGQNDLFVGRDTEVKDVEDEKENSQSETPQMTHEQILDKFKDMTIVSKRKRHLMVAAIDFGSAYSGCAFSFKSNYNRNPLDIHVMGIGDKGLESLKVPTVLLLDPEGKFVAFGHEAEQKYADLLQNDLSYANQCYYFSRFKMQLYKNKDLKKAMIIRDISDKKEMKAVDVFAFSIEFIKDSIFGRAKEQIRELQEEDVHWVLTVPAIWNEAARQFMIDAAEKAGIDPENLTLALEPEAAALCCKYLEIQKQKEGKEAKLGSFAVGSRFLVVDLGGGTVDITSNEVLESDQLKEIHSATGGPWGGNTINTEMWRVLRGIFGTESVKKFIAENRDDYLDMTRSIELKKRTANTTDKLTIDIPRSLLVEVKKNNPGVISENYKDKVKLQRGNRLQLFPEIVKGIFKGGVETISNYVKDLLEKPETAGVKTILLVGGYASCDLLRDAMKKKFKHLTVICPLSPDVIVLKGAVIMGHSDTPIVGRVAKYHYGVAILAEVNKHGSFDRSFRPLTDTKEEEFKTIIKKGQPIKVNDVVTEYQFPINYNQDEAFIRIYASEEDEPPKTISEDHCRQIGHIRIKLPRFRKNTNLTIGISNNETEFKVVARDEHTGKCFAGVCRFLS